MPCKSIKLFNMKNLDLKAYGVEELDKKEMMEVDGGGFWGNVSVGLAYVGMVAAAATGAGVVIGAIAVASVVVSCIAAEAEG